VSSGRMTHAVDLCDETIQAFLFRLGSPITWRIHRRRALPVALAPMQASPSNKAHGLFAGPLDGQLSLSKHLRFADFQSPSGVSWLE